MSDENVNGVAVFDFGAVVKKSDDGAILHLKDPRGQPIPPWIKLAGTNSKAYREASDVIGDRRLKRVNSKTGTAAKSMEEFHQDQAYLYASVTLGWEGIVVNGQVLECNKENAQKFYAMVPFVLNQVSEFVEDQANF